MNIALFGGSNLAHTFLFMHVWHSCGEVLITSLIPFLSDLFMVLLCEWIKQ